MPDLQCSRCGYNLRQHDFAACCPECNTPVALAFAEHPWWGGQAQVTLTRGLALFALGLASIVCAPILIWPMWEFFAQECREPMFTAVAAVCWGVVQQCIWVPAILIITSYAHRELALLAFVTRMAALVLTLGVAMLIIGSLMNAAKLEQFSGLFAQTCAIIAWCLILASSACLSAWFARLARLMDTRPFMWNFRAVSLVLATLTATCLLVMTWAMTHLIRSAWIPVGNFVQPAIIYIGWPTLAWLTLSCVAWRATLRKEVAALGMVHPIW